MIFVVAHPEASADGSLEDVNATRVVGFRVGLSPESLGFRDV